MFQCFVKWHHSVKKNQKKPNKTHKHKTNLPPTLWLSACDIRELFYGLMPVHFFTSSEIHKFISSWEIKNKNYLLSSLLLISALLPAVITVYSLSKQKYIFTSTSYCCVCWYRLPEGMSVNWAPSYIHIHIPFSCQPFPSPALFSLDMCSVFSVGFWALWDGNWHLNSCLNVSSVRTLIMRLLSLLSRERTNLLSLSNTTVAFLLFCEPACWINWSRRAGEMSCACIVAEYFTSWCCVKAALREDFIFSCSLMLRPFSWLDMCLSDNSRTSWLLASPRCQKHVSTSSPLTWWSLWGLIHYNSEELCLT